MATSKETINKDQTGDSSVEIYPSHTKAPKSLGKRKITTEALNPVRPVKMIKEKDINPTNCSKCNKKLKFISTFKCRCENFYCNKHRFYDQHDCAFDYKKHAINKLRETNPKIVAKKIGE